MKDRYMNSTTSTQKARLFKLLSKGTEVSINEVATRLDIANPSAVISQLRDEGAPIFTNRRKNAQGETVFKYRLNTKALATA